MANNVAIATIKVVTPMLVASAMKHVTPSMAIVVKITGSPATMILNFVSLQQQVSWNMTPYIWKNGHLREVVLDQSYIKFLNSRKK